MSGHFLTEFQLKCVCVCLLVVVCEQHEYESVFVAATRTTFTRLSFLGCGRFSGNEGRLIHRDEKSNDAEKTATSNL